MDETKKIFSVYETPDGIVIELKLRTVDMKDLEEAMRIIRGLIPKG